MTAPPDDGRDDDLQCTSFRGTELLALCWLAVLTAGCGSGTGTAFRDDDASVADRRALLSDADPQVQARGAFALSRGGAAEAVPELTEKLKSPSPLVRQNAALALASAGPAAKPAVPALTAALADPEWAVRRQAALALGAIGPDAKPALPALRKLEASDRRSVVRDAAKEARAKIGG
jgi:HEAT repeat protein